MLYRANPGQLSYGEVIGIIKLENYAPFIPGDVANATTYQFPVRYKRVPGLTPKLIFNHDMSVLESMVEACEDLKSQGVRAITGDCGFMGAYQKELTKRIDLPIFMSSLLQVEFMLSIISQTEQIGVITANEGALDEKVLKPCRANYPDRLVIRGLEKKPHFDKAIMQESEDLDTHKLEQEVVSVATELSEISSVKLILLECSMLPPYGAAVQEKTNLPVFDYITMINFVYSAVVKQRYCGLM